MIKKTLTIPIYDCKVEVIVTDNFEEACAEAGYDSNVPAHSATVFRYPDALGVYAVVFHENAISPGNIAHEGLHPLHDIMEYVDMGANTNDDEAQAYLLGFIVDGIHQIIHGHEKN